MSSVSLKYFLKSCSMKFMRDRKNKSHSIESYNWNGKPVFYRTSTSDQILIYEILLKKGHASEYFLPKEIQPKVILDIGGNVGITSIYLANKFPDAKIFTFEPVPQNFELLKKNTELYANIKVFNVGLGSANGSFDIFMSKDSENFGGASLYQDDNVSESIKVVCKIRNATEMLSEIGINKVDLIKIDTEGAEYDILMSLQSEIIANAKWITGELHGNKDFELLSYLESCGFLVGMKKNIDDRLFMFHCVKPEVAKLISKKDLKRIVK